MANETYVTVIGRLTADPELRFTPSGAAVANFTIAVNARKFDKNTNEWADQPAKFWRCEAWNQGKATLAENVAAALHKGSAVVAHAELRTREYEKDGQTRAVDELVVQAIGPDLRWAANTGTPAPRNDPGAHGAWTPDNGVQVGGGWNGQPANPDPWGGSTAAGDDEPPF